MTNDEWTSLRLWEDDGRELVFDGRVLGSASSETVGKDRWMEISIYVTTTGTYIVNVVGQSRRPGERVKSRVAICETAAAAVEALHQVDDDGVRYITGTARRAATAACDEDDEFRGAFMVQRVA